jgi:putative peptide zinc metalloprotease protein
MNILEAFDAALPEIPEKSMRRGYPKLDSRVIHKEHIELGAPVVLAKMPGGENYVRFAPEQWALLELFDGQRSYQELSALIQAQSGVPYTEDDVKEFTAFLRDNTDILYQTPLEKNITLQQKIGAHRHRRKRFAISDITEITLHRWPHADDYLSKLQPYLRFIYTTWFTALTFLCFAAMLGMWIEKFDEIWYDSFRFFNFTSKSGWDLLEFWFLFGALAFFHETAHGMTCKHFGAKVERMEFLLMYFAPTFMCDVTQVWVVGGRKARLWTVIAGIWVDLILCFIATVIWWTTAPGMWSHDFAYKVMMMTGIMITIANLNPLIKLDGYYMFAELVGEADLKEHSTLYVSQWVRRHIFKMPVEIEYVPRRRRLLYIVYATLSGIYGYLLIGFFAIFIYNVLRSYNPEYAWIPGLLIGGFFFRSRIGRFSRFMKDVYLDKKDRIRAWFTPTRTAISSAAAIAIAFAPIWPDFVQGRFVLEPVRHAVIRAEVPGVVTQVQAMENEFVKPGTPILRLSNLALESEAARANASLQEASAHAIRAGLSYSDLGRTEPERQERAERDRILREEVTHLEVASPIAGVVVTPRLQDLLGSYVVAGTQVAEVADVSTMRARIYIPEFGVRDVRPGMRVRLLLNSRFFPIRGALDSMAPQSSTIDAGLAEKAQLSGIVPPPFYVGFVTVENDGTLRQGLTGTAKLFVRYRSLAAITGRFGRDLFERRFW